MEKKKKIEHSLLLLLAAAIWGVAFVAQSVGMDYVGPLTFNASRFILGSLVLIPFIWHRRRGEKEKRRAVSAEDKRKQRKTTLTGGLCCGMAICTASLFQQYGIKYTTVGKAGFITTLYIIIVPIMGILLHKKVKNIVWVGAAMAAVGLYLLCVNESLSLNIGDVLVFICAVIFSVHILVIDYFSPKADGVTLSCIQFLFSGIVCGIGAFLFENPNWGALCQGWMPILYAGIFSCGVAYTLQIIGQKDMDPTIASLILSLESVISVLAGWILLNQSLRPKELLGCGLVFAAVLLVQIKS